MENSNLEQAQMALASFQTDEFDEVLPVPIRVSFMDYVPYKA